jgi:hypothetical protein
VARIAGGGAGLVAATDQRLLLLWSSSRYEELQYGDLISVTDETSAGGISLVTPHDVHQLKILPAARAAEIVKAAATRISGDRIHPAAGADEARRMTATLRGAVVSVRVAVSIYALGVVLSGVAERLETNRRAHEPISKGSCVNLHALKVACSSDTAFFEVLGDRDMKRCPASSAVIIDTLAATKANKRKLSRWCISLAANRAATPPAVPALAQPAGVFRLGAWRQRTPRLGAWRQRTLSLDLSELVAESDSGCRAPGSDRTLVSMSRVTETGMDAGREGRSGARSDEPEARSEVR